MEKYIYDVFSNAFVGTIICVSSEMTFSEEFNKTSNSVAAEQNSNEIFHITLFLVLKLE